VAFSDLLASRLAHLEPRLRSELIALLDELTAPLTRRAIEKALAPVFTRKQRVQIVPALMLFDIVTIRRAEGQPCAD
jgi:GGDEF domain-containing protein